MTVKPEHLGGDRWRVRIYVADGIRGRQIQRSFRADGARAANKAASKIETELRDRKANIEKARGTVADLAKRWLTHRERQGDSPSTLRRTRQIAGRITDDLGPTQLGDLGSLQVDEWLDGLRTEVSESTVHHYFRVLRSMLRQGRRWGMVETIATEAATPPKAGRSKVDPPTPEVLGVVLAGCTPHLRFAAALAARTGLRRGELVGLRWCDIEGGDPAVMLVRGNVVEIGGQLIRKGTKTGAEREVWLDPGTWLAMMRHRHDLEQAAVRCGVVLDRDAAVLADMAADPTGRVPRRPGWLTLAWSRACDRVGARIRLHDLRHFHATQLLERGLSLAEAAERLGHAQVTTTANTYAHGTQDGKRRAAQIAAGMPS